MDTKDVDRPVVLVTGCSSGIGREATVRLARAGAHVVATARRVETLDDLRGPHVAAMALDVTDAAQCAAVVAAVLEAHGRIDALVNNAGFGVMTAVEDTDTDLLRRMLATNVEGPHALARLVLPGMRARGRGRIINVSSIAGHVAVPMMGAYCATKFALRALTQALHNEVRPFGVHAGLVEPGVIRTDFGARSLRELREAVPDPSASPYAPWYARWERMRASRGGAHPRTVARRIVHACLAQRPRFHYFSPLHAKVANVAKRLLPDAALHLGYRAWFRPRRG